MHGLNAISTLTCVVAGCPAVWTTCSTSRTGNWPSVDGCVRVWAVNSVCWTSDCSICTQTPFWPAWAGACGSPSRAVLPRTWLGRCSVLVWRSTSWLYGITDVCRRRWLGSSHGRRVGLEKVTRVGNTQL